MKRFAVLFCLIVSTTACEVEVGNGLCVDSMPLGFRPRPPHPCEKTVSAPPPYEYDEAILKNAEANGIDRERAKRLIGFAMSAGY